jgi:hypothetical protein
MIGLWQAAIVVMSRFCTRSTCLLYFAGSVNVIHGLTAPNANSINPKSQKS